MYVFHHDTKVSYLIVMNCNAEFVVKLQSLSPNDSPEPEAVVAVNLLRLRRNVQDVLPLVQRTHILTCGT